MAAFVPATTAHAKLYEQDHYQSTNTEVLADYCDVPGLPDLTVEREQSFTGLFMARALGSQGIVSFSEQFRFVTVRTNVANGKTLTTEGVVNNRPQHIADNGDGTLTVRWSSFGNDRSYDNEGTIVARSTLRFEFEALVDHNGTPGNPDDDTVLSGELTKLVGHETEGDFCALVHETIG